jgi:hypothetical protein
MSEPMITKPLSTVKIPNPNACGCLHISINVQDGVAEYTCTDGSWWRCNKNVECPICAVLHSKSVLPCRAEVTVADKPCEICDRHPALYDYLVNEQDGIWMKVCYECYKGLKQ